MGNNHHAVELERALLGLVLVSPSSVNKVRGFIVPADFYDAKNREVFQAMNDLLDEGTELEIVTILNKLKDNDALEKIGGDKYITDLMKQAGLEANVNKFMKVITDKAQLRKVGKVIDAIQSDIKKVDVDADTILEKVEQDILSTTRDAQQKDFATSHQVVKNMLLDIEKKAAQEGISGLPSDLPSLDAMTSGFQKGDLIILAARPSMGKTAFALNLAANISKKHTVALFSLEMPSEQLMKRVISFTGFVDGKKLREPNMLTNEDWTKVHIASEKAQKLNLYIDDSAGIKLSEVVWKAKKLAKNKGLDMIVIDYLQLITVGNTASDNRQAEVSLISRTLKMLARELEIPIIALSQLSRKVEMRENKTPMMSDLRESGAIEQDADIIAFLYREAYYDKEKSQNSKHQKTDIIISKHRNGSTGNVSLSFNPGIGLFTDRAPEEE